MDKPHENTYDYSAIAVTKTVTYQISYADMFKIPQKTRDQMANIASTRRQVIIQWTLELYKNLKNIKKKLDGTDHEENVTDK